MKYLLALLLFLLATPVQAKELHFQVCSGYLVTANDALSLVPSDKLCSSSIVPNQMDKDSWRRFSSVCELGQPCKILGVVSEGKWIRIFIARLQESVTTDSANLDNQIPAKFVMNHCMNEKEETFNELCADQIQFLWSIK
jgi:hypothetical protein